MKPTDAQPAPARSSSPLVYRLVLVDLEDRVTQGKKKYGVALRPHNGRDALMDAYQEAIDLVMYLRQAIYERDHVEKDDGK